jgi:hypothetical protein
MHATFHLYIDISTCHPYTVHRIQYTLYSIQNSIECISTHRIQYTVYSIQYTIQYCLYTDIPTERILSRARSFRFLACFPLVGLKRPKSTIFEISERWAVMPGKHTICYTLATFHCCQRHQHINILATPNPPICRYIDISLYRYADIPTFPPQS